MFMYFDERTSNTTDKKQKYKILFWTIQAV